MRKYLITSFLIAVAIWPSMYGLYRQFYVTPFVETHFPTENYNPFFETWYGITTIAVWIIIGSSWAVIGLRWRMGSKGKIAFLTTVLLLATVLSVSATSWRLNWNKILESSV